MRAALGHRPWPERHVPGKACTLEGLVPANQPLALDPSQTERAPSERMPALPRPKYPTGHPTGQGAANNREAGRRPQIEGGDSGSTSHHSFIISRCFLLSQCTLAVYAGFRERAQPGMSAACKPLPCPSSRARQAVSIKPCPSTLQGAPRLRKSALQGSANQPPYLVYLCLTPQVRGRTIRPGLFRPAT